MPVKLPLRIRYNGGLAADGMLPLYDGTSSIHGVAQAIQIATHALLTETIVTRATAARSATFFLYPTKAGSYLVDIAAFVEANPAMAGITAPIFYDWIKAIFIKATSRAPAEPETAKVKKWIEKDEPFLDELAETLEGSLQRAHRPIGSDVSTITLERPRSPFLTLDTTTKAWVNTRDVANATTPLTGNVTRFNSVTRNGRAFINELGRIVPFKPDGDFATGSFQYLTWSLHGSTNDLPKSLKIDAREVKSATGETKRLLLADALRDE